MILPADRRRRLRLRAAIAISSRLNSNNFAVVFLFSEFSCLIGFLGLLYGLSTISALEEVFIKVLKFEQSLAKTDKPRFFAGFVFGKNINL